MNSEKYNMFINNLIYKLKRKVNIILIIYGKLLI